MKKRNVRPQITWVNKTIASPANAATRNLPYFFDDDENYKNFKYVKNLIPGSLWFWLDDFFLVDLHTFNDQRRRGGPTESEFKRLTFQQYDIHGYSVPQRSYMIYTGTVRVDEKSKHDKIVSVLRHTFFVDGTRCIVLNLQACVPVL
jgi:hypothetical protein